MSDLETTVENSTESSHLDSIFGDTETVVEQGLTEEVTAEDVDENAEEGAEEEKPQETNDEQSELLSRLEALESQLGEKDKQIANAQSLIDRQGNELGQLRPQVEKYKELSPDEFLDKFADDPIQAQKELLQNELDRRESARAEQEQQIAQNRSTVLKLAPDFDTNVDGIKEWYKEKGASDDFVQNLNPNSLLANVDLAVALTEIQNLKKQIAETKSKNTQVIDKLNKGTAVVTGKSGQSSNSDSLQIPSNVADLSDKQIEELLKRAS